MRPTKRLRYRFGTNLKDNMQEMNSNAVALLEAQESRNTQRKEVRVAAEAQCVDCDVFLVRGSWWFQPSEYEFICWSREDRRRVGHLQETAHPVPA